MPGRRKGKSAKVGHGLASKGGGKGHHGSKGGYHGSKGSGRGRGAGTARFAAPEGGDSPGAAQSPTWLERVRKQVDFYFSSAHLRQDAFMRKKIADGDGFVELAAILQFNRIRALRCKYHPQLVQAIGKSDVLALSEDKTKVRRIPGKASAEEGSDPVPRTIYVEIIPLTFGLDMLTEFFARHGRVLLLDLPRHSQTREPRGFCFVEYSTTEEAAAAVKALHGAWPESWPARFDGQGFRAISKERWLEYKREFKALQQSARASGGRSVPPALAGSAEEGHGASASDADTLAVSSTAVASTLPVSSASSVSGKPGAQPGCLIRISGFLQPQTVLSIRQFAEHAVPVMYCDFQADTASAVVRLRSPDDCSRLLEDLRLSQRMLGWVRPKVETMSREEEAVHWHKVEQRRSSNDGGAKNPNAKDGQEKPELSKKVRSRLFRPLLSMVQNPHGVIRRGPLKTSTLKRWGRRLPFPHRGMRQDGASSAKAGAASFIDTVCGSDNGVLPGFGHNFGQPRKHRKRGGQRRKGYVPPPPLPPPRTREGEPPAKAARRTATPPPSPAVPLAPPSPACGGAAAGAATAPIIGGAKAKRLAAPNRPPVPAVPPRTPGREIPLPPPSPRPPVGQNKPPSPVRPRDGAGGRATGPSLPPPSPVAGRAAYDVATPRGEPHAGEAKEGQDSMLEDAADILALDD